MQNLIIKNIFPRSLSTFVISFNDTLETSFCEARYFSPCKLSQRIQFADSKNVISPKNPNWIYVGRLMIVQKKFVPFVKLSFLLPPVSCTTGGDDEERKKWAT